MDYPSLGAVMRLLAVASMFVTVVSNYWRHGDIDLTGRYANMRTIYGRAILIGVVIAYIYRTDAPDLVKTHFTFQIRTFWLALIGGLIGLITTAIVIGFFLLLAVLVWQVVRIVKGWKWLADNQPVPNPESLTFGS